MGKWFVEFFLVFVGYTAAYTFTLGFIYPVQKIVMPENSLMASVLFLPHGVRAIAFFLFGLKAALYLLPAHYAMWYISVHGADIGLDLFSPLVSVLGCFFAFLRTRHTVWIGLGWYRMEICRMAIRKKGMRRNFDF